MPSQTILPQGTYAIGTYVLGPASIPVGVSGAVLALSGVAMTDPALNVSMQLDLSLDGGTTWASTTPSQTTDPFPVTLTLVGGMKDRHTGLQQDPYFVSVAQIPSPASSTRKIRATVVVSGAALTTQGTLTLT